MALGSVRWSVPSSQGRAALGPGTGAHDPVWLQRCRLPPVSVYCLICAARKGCAHRGEPGNKGHIVVSGGGGILAWEDRAASWAHAEEAWCLWAQPGGRDRSVPVSPSQAHSLAGPGGWGGGAAPRLHCWMSDIRALDPHPVCWGEPSSPAPRAHLRLGPGQELPEQEQGQRGGSGHGCVRSEWRWRRGQAGARGSGLGVWRAGQAAGRSPIPAPLAAHKPPIQWGPPRWAGASAATGASQSRLWEEGRGQGGGKQPVAFLGSASESKLPRLLSETHTPFSKRERRSFLPAPPQAVGAHTAGLLCGRRTVSLRNGVRKLPALPQALSGPQAAQGPGRPQGGRVPVSGFRPAPQP